MSDLILEAGYWGSNVPTLGVSKYEGFHVVVDDGEMGMPISGETYRVGVYENSESDEAIFMFEGEKFQLSIVTNKIKESIMAIKTIEKLVKALGNGFHPDSFIGDYVDQNDRPSFTDEDCRTLQIELDFANRILGDNVYNVASNFFPN